MYNSSPHQTRVAVTGMGAICSLGHNLNEIWANILKGQSGISLLEDKKLENFSIKMGGAVTNYQLSGDILPEKDQRRFDEFIHFALGATDEALQQSQIHKDNKPYESHRIGCILGVGVGGLGTIEENHTALMNKGPRRVSPFLIPGMISNMAPGLISIHWGIHGLNYTVTSACSSSLHALTNAYHEIKLGTHDLIITGGAEKALTPLGISGFTTMKALSKDQENPEKASRPFDLNRNGFVMAEGAGILVLENYDKAKERGAPILGEIVGAGFSSDANHTVAPHPEGLGASLSMESAIKNSGISKEEITYINAHGTSTPLGDKIETSAIKKTFGSHAQNLFVSSTKSMTGHLLGAAGGMESIFCLKSLESNMIPPTINLDTPDPECDLNYVPHKAIEKNYTYALNNSFGFGGTNSTVIFKKGETS